MQARESGRFASPGRAFACILALLATAGILIYFFSSQGTYDEVFGQLEVGMLQEEVESKLGPGQDAPQGGEFGTIVGFGSVDQPPLDDGPPPIRLWWFNGQDRYLYVDFIEGRVARACLFGPSQYERRLGK